MADFLQFDHLYIAGEPQAGESDELEVEDPTYGAVFTAVPTASAAQVEATLRAAREAFDGGPWPRMSVSSRVAALSRMADWLSGHRDELVETIICETGSTSHVARWAQIDMAIDQARQLPELLTTLPEWEHNELALNEYIGSSGTDVALSIRRFEACGVVAAITPYNFPLQTAVWKVFSALAAGCPVILRPSPLAPLTALALGAAAAEADLPVGVFSVVVEAGPEGAQTLTSDPRVDCVSFTGSTFVGRKVAAQAAPTVKRLLLELGGKSVQLYLPDALARVEAGAIGVFTALSGQGCALQTRMLVPSDCIKAVIERVANAARSLAVGDPRDPATLVGPVISAAQRDRIEQLIEAGTTAGGWIAAGGQRPTHLDQGYFIEPTVVVVDSNKNPLAQEEVFGPVITIQGYDDLDHAVSIANDTQYGLSGGIYTNNLPAGVELANRIRSGTVQINRGAANAYTPMGGVKQSGLGRERGVAGLREYQEIKHVVIAGASQ